MLSRFYLTRTVSPPAYCVSDIMTCLVPGGPTAPAVPFAVLWLDSRYAISPAALLRLKLAVVISAQCGPSLKALVFHSYFALVRNIEQFRLTRHVTYSQYRAACGSGRVDIEQLLPPEFPAITLIIPSRPARTVRPTPPVPPVRHGSAPRRVGSSLAWRRSRFCPQTRTFTGVLSVTRRFFKVDCPFHGRDGDVAP